jgi:hypothetical protein
MPDPQPKPGEPTGTPNPAPGQAPGQTPASPDVPGQAQTPPAGVPPQGPKPGVPLDRQPQTPGVPGDQTVPLKALQEEREKRQQLQQELEQVKQLVQGAQQPNAGQVYGTPQASPQAPQATNDVQAKELERLWETDPRMAVRAEIDQSLSYYDTVNAQIESQGLCLTISGPRTGSLSWPTW